MMIESDEKSGARSPMKLVSPNSRLLMQEGGFISPVNLCLNILYSFLIQNSSGFQKILDRSQENGKLESSKMWIQICKILNKNSVLKLKMVAKSIENDSLIKQLEPLVTASLRQKKVLEEQNLAEVLSVIDQSIETTYNDMITSVESMFIDYDLLEEETNIMQHRLVFKSNPKKIDQFIGLLSKNKYFEELGPSDKLAKISVYIADNFEPTAALLNEVGNIEKLFGRSKYTHTIKHMESLSKFFEVD